MGVLGEGWKILVYKMNGRMKLRGVKLKELIMVLMFLKNGIVVFMSVVIVISVDWRMRCGIRFWVEYLFFCIFDDLFLKILKVGCVYICKI